MATQSSAQQPVVGARVGIVTFPGSLDQDGVARAVRLAGGETVPVWHADTQLPELDALVLPGGSSYGNYLRAGALASLAPLVASIADAAAGGLPILGIANGFQILTEANLLPGSLDRNDGVRFRCSEQRVAVENVDTAWTRGYTRGQTITLPFKNEHGRFTASAAELDEIEANGQVVLRYAGDNPTGSDRDIAGVANAAGNVVGLMVHPEYAIESGFGPDTDAGHRTGTDGLKVFTSALSGLLATRA